MDIEKFKKESTVTYVHVKGDYHGIAIMKAYAQRDFKYDDHRLIFEGFIIVPFGYADFCSCSKKQQLAICQAELIKSGVNIHLTEIDANSFYAE